MSIVIIIIITISSSSSSSNSAAADERAGAVSLLAHVSHVAHAIPDTVVGKPFFVPAERLMSW